MGRAVQHIDAKGLHRLQPQSGARVMTRLGSPGLPCMATEGGCTYAMTMSDRQISMANDAFAMALRGRLSCSLWIMRISGATKGACRVGPASTGWLTVPDIANKRVVVASRRPH